MLVSIFSSLGQAQVALLHRRYLRATCELPPYWIIPASNCVNTKENTLRFLLSLLGHTQFYKYANKIGFGLQTFGAHCLQIPYNNPNT